MEGKDYNNGVLQAINEGDWKQLEANILQGHNVNIHDRFGKSAIFLAVEKNFTDCLNVLLRHETNVNLQNSDLNGKGNMEDHDKSPINNVCFKSPLGFVSNVGQMSSVLASKLHV